MTETYYKLKQLELFDGITEKDLPDVLNLLDARVLHYKKASKIMLEGEKFDKVGIVLNGVTQITRIDYSGNRLIIGQLIFPSMFGEAIAFSENETCPITLTAVTDAQILLINYNNLIDHNQNSVFHNIIYINMMKILAKKNLFLRQRLDVLSRRSIRSKISIYLLSIAELTKSLLEIPYDRSQLADYLCVNRSALSRELSKMDNEGILSFKKNKFTIYDYLKLYYYANQSSDSLNTK